MAGLRDIRPMLKEFGKKQTVFEPAELLEIADTLAASGRLRLFLTNLEPAESEPSASPWARSSAISSRPSRRSAAASAATNACGTTRPTSSGRFAAGSAQLSENIHQRFMSIVASPALRKAIENDNFLMRHGRPVVAVKSNYRNVIRGTVLDRSNTGATLYVEPDELVELSNELEDAVFEEKKEVGRILWLLTKMVLDQQEAILDSVKMLALVDLTYAKARFSIAYGMSPPDLDAGRVAAPSPGPPSAAAPVGEPAEGLPA